MLDVIVSDYFSAVAFIGVSDMANPRLVYDHISFTVHYWIVKLGLLAPFAELDYDLDRDYVQSQKSLELETITKILITLNHEINSPLTAIMLASQFLLKHGQHDQAEQKLLESLCSDALRISQILKEMGQITTPNEEEYLPGISMIKANRAV